MEHEGDGDTNCNRCTRYNRQRIGKWTGRLGNKRPPPRLKHYYDRPEYREEFWRLEETCCHSNSSEKPSANACEKNSQRSKIIIMIKRETSSNQRKRKKRYVFEPHQRTKRAREHKSD